MGTASLLVDQLKSPSVLLGTALAHTIRHNVGMFPYSTSVYRFRDANKYDHVGMLGPCLGLRLSTWTAPVSGFAGAAVTNVLGYWLYVNHNNGSQASGFSSSTRGSYRPQRLTRRSTRYRGWWPTNINVLLEPTNRSLNPAQLTYF